MVDQVADRVKFDKEEDIKPLVITFRKIFEPMTKAMKNIALIPKEVSRIVDVIRKDIKSGQPDRFVSGSKKSADSVDMIQMYKNFTERNSEEGKRRQKELEDLEKIAQKQQKAIEEQSKLLELGVPAEITKDNEVKILNEKEIIEKQKEYIKEQKEVTFLEKQIADEKGKGEDADSERLLILKEALDKQNQLAEEQGKILGNRLPVQKVPETVTARDFIPGPLMEAYDNIADSATQSAEAIGSIFKPLIGLRKKFMQKEEYEEEEQEGKKKRDKGNGLAMLLATVKLIAFAASLAVAIKAMYKLGQMAGIIDKPEDPTERRPGETQQQHKERLVKEQGMTYEEAGKKSRPQGNEGFLFVPRMFGLGDAMDASERRQVYKDKMRDTSKTFENIGLLNQYDFTKQGKGDTYNVVTKGGDTSANIAQANSVPTSGNGQDIEALRPK